ncbi:MULTISPECIES: YbaN family protein [Pseudoalteromonas]|uniref:Inner membrane protein n=1 Tax=Pseudoalteromonas obscura TaxID=3048491 RepID=A0ABT7ET27_9GAMM|nr:MULTISPECIES: YbaN family protein [Pseudoalteromonas]MBQ4839713.1 YbaN family protein [Pseudoalteromonas luteoviolacea]MDK2598207.1 YbaN family protein [Pseudoalteromonas sp. P94(2023)]
MKKLFNRCFWLHAAGIIFVGLGFIGMALPVMPTTIFFILALACFSRSSPKFENWLLTHPKFGPSLVAWREYQVVPPKGKWGAGIGMLIGYIALCFSAAPWYVLIIVAVIEILALTYILTRPSQPPITSN